MPDASALDRVRLLQGDGLPTVPRTDAGGSSRPTTSQASSRETPTEREGPPSREDAPPPLLGVSLSPATAPFPKKLVERIQSGQFVDMRDLLTDNVSLLQQLDTLGGQFLTPALPGVLKPRLREVATLPAWIYCFLAYVALRVTDPLARDMLAYARLIIREAQRHGGSGWLDYDRVFRQQAALDPTLKWTELHPGIQASTLVGRSTRQSPLCTHCREPDHTSEQCALSYLQAPRGQQPATTLPGGALTGPAGGRPRPRRPETMLRICVSWNKGRCTYPGCTYLHVCATCRRDHMARDCSATPANSEYKSFPPAGIPPLPVRAPLPPSGAVRPRPLM